MRSIEKATDMELVIDMANHINYPCFFLEGTDEYIALRKSYIVIAKERMIPTLTNPFSKLFLEKIIKRYEP